ncbi:ABC transporter ATP-binding protein [Pseudonocardia alaniniphila]|uniref:ABC transporter ATP-binding protein n=1 Tax=Pseudonocardia alaniniphila TaxID=75291 RepID=A0ABS9TU83_9PSEU|nr:ABC transporter ATP-binding protein [Pseudonocardia alaniniphila]MCH6172119.1 ABC transporter ATP-binding protein [Pseudonocardia alaniniphila]
MTQHEVGRSEDEQRPGGTPLLEVTDLSVAFDTRHGRSTVVDEISFSIDRGKTLGVVGESGSGKSMTSLAIIGLLPKGARTSGSVTFKGEELLGRREQQMRRIRGDQIAMIFQDPLSSLNPYYTVGLQIEEAYLAHRGGGRKNARTVAIDAMRRVKIPDPDRRVDHYPHQFSGGMRQRVMIAMALCCEPDLIIADEPTTALDVTVQAQILELISMLQSATGAAMLFITHDLAVVSQIADDVHVLRNGRTMETGPTEQIFSRPENEYTRELLAAVPRIEDAVDFSEPAGRGAQ